MAWRAKLGMWRTANTGGAERLTPRTPRAQRNRPSFAYFCVLGVRIFIRRRLGGADVGAQVRVGWRARRGSDRARTVDEERRARAATGRWGRGRGGFRRRGRGRWARPRAAGDTIGLTGCGGVRARAR